MRVRPAAANELTAAWPDAGRLLPRDWGREIDRTLVLELEAELDSQACRVPDAPGEFGRAVSALRLATPGAIAAGPVVFERLDFRPTAFARCRRRPRRFRPVRRLDSTSSVLLSSSSCRRGSRTRLTSFSRRSTGGSSPSSTRARTDRMSCARRSETLLGCDEGPWAAAMRAAVLLGETAREREDLLVALRALLDGDGPGAYAETRCVEPWSRRCSKAPARISSSLSTRRSSACARDRRCTRPPGPGRRDDASEPGGALRRRRCRLLVVGMVLGALLPVFEWSWITLAAGLGGVAVLLLVYRRECTGCSAQDSTQSDTHPRGREA